MHQTTVRFSAELWEALEVECERLGVSVAQFVREAALTRIVYAAGRRGDEDFDLALDLVTGNADPAGSRRAEDVAERALREGSEAAALAAQGRLARKRARALREQVAHRRHT